MIPEPAFPTEPWCVRETSLDLSLLAQSESIFALSNGHIGLRGNLDEGDPHGTPGTYLNSVYELRPLPYAEAGYGYPESGQTVVDVTNGKIIRLTVEDEPFDIRYGTVRSHERVLDLRAGTLYRAVEWESPAGSQVRVRSTRLVSFSQRSVAAISYEVEALDAPLRITVQSELVANEDLPPQSADPRAAALLEHPLISEQHISEDEHALLIHRTRASGLLIAAAMAHVIDGPQARQVSTASWPDWARTTVLCSLQPGERLRIVKFIAYGWSSQRTVPALRDQAGGAMDAAVFCGWDGLLAEQRAWLDEFWDVADVIVEGDAEVQQAVRFGLFHAIQAGARAERRAIPAKGLTGPGYDGHAFWDTESFVLPVLTYTLPAAAADALRWRHSILDFARDRAAQLGLAGATFPWRTIRGHECSAYWPAGTAAFHINADVASAVLRYVRATEDVQFEHDVGLEILVETARLWLSLGHHDSRGAFHIEGVTGPDEYSAIADDNVYTNLMAQENLLGAAETCARHPDHARGMGVDLEEMAAWRDAAHTMHIPYDDRLRVHPQAQRFTEHEMWDFDKTPPDHYPLLLHYPYFDLYRKQVVKQPDLVLALHWRGDAFTPEQKARNVDYYERLTVRDSSLAACTQAIMAAEVGHLDLAHDYIGEAALMDLHDLEHNTRDGMHIASLAGTWLALVAGLGGFREYAGEVRFDPALPDGFDRLAFAIRWRGNKLRVDVNRESVSYLLEAAPAHTGTGTDAGSGTGTNAGTDADAGSGTGTAGAPERLTIWHAGEAVELENGVPVRRDLVARIPLLPRPPQPSGRQPLARRPR
jgi:alpha,alpha-trehalose phosphorylase